MKAIELLQNLIDANVLEQLSDTQYKVKDGYELFKYNEIDGDISYYTIIEKHQSIISVKPFDKALYEKRYKHDDIVKNFICKKVETILSC